MGRAPDADIERAAVKGTLELLKARAPGRSVEVRVPPYAAVQVVDGVKHRRGTPAAVVEANPMTWLRVASGQMTWAEAVTTGSLTASGERSDLSAYVPLT